jgi:hypothetical protein
MGIIENIVIGDICERGPVLSANEIVRPVKEQQKSGDAESGNYFDGAHVEYLYLCIRCRRAPDSIKLFYSLWDFHFELIYKDAKRAQIKRIVYCAL